MFPNDPDQEAIHFQQLRDAIASQPTSQKSITLLAPDGLPDCGQIWRTCTGPDADPETDSSPMVVLLESPPVGIAGGGPYFHAAPIFREVHQIGPEDILLPAEVMGVPWAVATGAWFMIDRQNLRSCYAALPEDWLNKIRVAASREISPAKENFRRGYPYTGTGDPRRLFHSELIESTVPMQDMAWARLEMLLKEQEAPAESKLARFLQGALLGISSVFEGAALNRAPLAATSATDASKPLVAKYQTETGLQLVVVFSLQRVDFVIIPPLPDAVLYDEEARVLGHFNENGVVNLDFSESGSAMPKDFAVLSEGQAVLFKRI